MSGRSPYGERGLKYGPAAAPGAGRSRSPYGERGLKSLGSTIMIEHNGSLPLRGAWIEIYSDLQRDGSRQVAPLTGSVD